MPLILCILAILGLIAWIVYSAAENNQQATYVEEGNIKFVMYGRTLAKTLVNVAGYFLKRGAGFFEIQLGVEDPDPNHRVKIEDANKKVILELPGVIGIPVKIPVINAIMPVLNHEEEFGKPASADGKIPAVAPLSEAEKQKRRRERKQEDWLQENGPKWLKGLYWVSILYPYGHLHKFEVSRIRLKEYSLDRVSEKIKVSDLVEQEEPLKDADFLLWQFPRPIIVSVEFKDLLTADIVVETLQQVVMPYRPVFAYKANFFPVLSAVIQSAVIDFCRGVTLQEFVRYFRTGYAAGVQTGTQDKVTDFYLRAISRINGSMQMAPRGTIEEFGIYVRNAWVAGIIPTDKTEKVKEALQAQGIAEMTGEAAKRTAELLGDAKVTEETKAGQAALARAKLEAEAIVTIGNAKAGATGTRLKAVGAENSDVLKQEMFTDALKETKVTSLVLGTNAGVVVSTDAAKKEPAAP